MASATSSYRNLTEFIIIGVVLISIFSSLHFSLVRSTVLDGEVSGDMITVFLSLCCAFQILHFILSRKFCFTNLIIYILSVLNCSIFTEYISKTHHTINQNYQINLTINYLSSKILLGVYLFCSSCFHNTSNLKSYRCHALSASIEIFLTVHVPPSPTIKLPAQLRAGGVLYCVYVLS